MPTTPSSDAEERRPTLVLLVYCWDLFLAILALFGALAPLGGGLQLGGSIKPTPLPLEILAALSSASYAVVLVIVATLLTRRQRWIQRTQILVFALAVGLGALSLLVAALTGGIATGPLLVIVLFLLIDAAAILVMTERRIGAWYVEPGPMPWYASGTLVFWVLSSVALVVLDAVT
ncbi:MAG: hypothetical protein JOY68_11565 [Candidatus Dormibacteraeota bacterium]|nr:hypothetical protein [Candidatus Dormibacteraeota bacterium]MBV8446013.1 hypothetical protein [Candidatus Dormibacteraeota bacterium]